MSATQKPLQELTSGVVSYSSTTPPMLNSFV